MPKIGQALKYNLPRFKDTLPVIQTGTLMRGAWIIVDNFND
jgi:hypothetical protein